jgi:hypothetical protein
VDEAADDGMACAVCCAAEDDGEAEGREEADDAVQPVKLTAKSPDIKSLKICFLTVIPLPSFPLIPCLLDAAFCHTPGCYDPIHNDTSCHSVL